MLNDIASDNEGRILFRSRQERRSIRVIAEEEFRILELALYRRKIAVHIDSIRDHP